jgi:TRAP-type mannitol/chloroaromatic compound transport system permease small subunit
MSAASEGAVSHDAGPQEHRPGTGMVRSLGWIIILLTFAWVINAWLTVWWDWPGVGLLFDGEGSVALGSIQFLLFALAIVAPLVLTKMTAHRGLRQDAMTMAGISNFIIRFAFWSVLFVGLADAVISFLRVEGILAVFVGEQITSDLGRSSFRGTMVHMPLMAVALIIAFRSKGLGFTWLALMVVIAELTIVISRFVFSYEQALQGDLVRFWYAALFLFASAYTLFDDGHVRVDVVYAGLAPETKGIINAVGAVLLGVTLCWTILFYGMWDQSSTINAPILAYEVSQAGFGLYVKYWMAGFLAIFAVSMTVQFMSMMLEGIADFWGLPGKRETVVTGH